MDYPHINKVWKIYFLAVIFQSLVHLPEADIDLTILKYEFSNLIFVVLSTNGKLGDMVISFSNTFIGA